MSPKHRIIAIECTTADGVIEDLDGFLGSPSGGWALRWPLDTPQVSGDVVWVPA